MARLRHAGEQIGALLLAILPLPLAIWLARIDWFQSARGSVEDALPLLVVFALVAATYVGLRTTERLPVRAKRQITAPAATEAPISAVSEGASSVELIEDVTGERGVLLSRSATTRRGGMCGELWLFQGGLLRIPLGWRTTLLTNGGRFYDARRLRVRTFDSGEFARVTSDPRNLWVLHDSIESATLRHLMGYDEVRMTLTDGRALRLLVSPSPATYERLRAALGEWLGERLVVD